MLLAQAGYGRGQKVHTAIDEGLVSGVILSPKDERRERLEECVRELRAASQDTVLLVDPQFYVTAMSAPRDGRLPEYDYYADNAGLSRTQFSPRQIEGYVKSCLDYQAESLRGVTYLVSPTILFDDFRDSWSQIALNMAEASIDYHATLDDPPPLLISVLTSEVALRDATRLGEFLDALSSLDAEGFYLLVNRNSSSYQAAMDPRAMENLLYFVYVLAELNDYKVLAGYSDWLGMFLHAVGATATASGWHQSLRQFSTARFEPAVGGRRPRKRYSAAPLLSSPLIVPELEDIHRAGFISDVLTGSPHDQILRANPTRGEAAWTDEISCLAHWAALDNIITTTVQRRRVANRLDTVTGLIDAADALYDRFAHRGVYFEPQTGPDHLRAWRDAVTAFRTTAGV